jgi:hypothetical protein
VLGNGEFQAGHAAPHGRQCGGHPAGELHRQAADVRAERIIAEELGRNGWAEQDLATTRKNDPIKLEIAARLRRETTLPIKAIAARLHLGTSKGANANLHRHMRLHGVSNPTGQAQLGI